MKDRIRQIMESQHMTQQVFAEFIGTTPATLSGIFNDRTRPTINIVEAIKKKIPDINTDWLLFGHGSMYKVADSDSDAQGGEQSTFQSSRNLEPSIFDFAAMPSSGVSRTVSATTNGNGVRSTRQDYPRDELKIPDKPQRHVTEIRVYYDDQTWESFVPSKK